MSNLRASQSVRAETSFKRKLTEAIEARLETYGHAPGMTPKKYRNYLAVWRMINLRGGVCDRYRMTEDDYKLSLYWLDKILPP